MQILLLQHKIYLSVDVIVPVINKNKKNRCIALTAMSLFLILVISQFLKCRVITLK